MISAIASFELRYQLRQPLFWLTGLLFAALTFGAMTTDSVVIGGSIGNVHRNASFVILQFLGFMSVLGVFVITAFVASSARRDFDHNTDELFFARPIGKWSYLLGRLAGSLAVSVGVFLFAALGLAIGSFMPWLDPERLGRFRLLPYAYALGVIVVPNLLFVGMTFFAAASLTRSMLGTYLTLVGFFVAYAVAQALLGDLDHRALAALLDPFGMTALAMATKYWTAVERNTAVPEFSGVLLWNRVLWLAVGLTIFLAAGRLFSHARQSVREGGRARRRRDGPAPASESAPAPGSTALPVVTRRFTGRVAWHQLARQTHLELTAVLKSVPFIVIVAFGVFNLIVSTSMLGSFYGTSVHPVTHLMLQGIESSFVFLLVIITTFYAGELIWRERGLKLDQVFDALPVPSWVPLAAKLSALVAVIAVFMIVGALGTMGFQLYHGYHRFEFAVYARGLLVAGWPFVLIAVLAVFFQVVTNNKFAGYLLMVLYLINEAVLSALDFDHNLYRYAGSPRAIYSDMNGYGHFVRPLAWFYCYWTLAAALLLGACALLWVRGNDRGLRLRWRLARQRLRGSLRYRLAACLTAYIAVGGWIFYNTNVLNEYVPDDANQLRSALYERRYRRYIDVAQPRVQTIDVDVDIYPRRRRVDIRGRYVVANTGDQAISTLHLNIPRAVDINRIELGEHRLVRNDREVGYYIYELARPLSPGETMPLSFDLTVQRRGFVNHGADSSIARNGTFFNNRQYLPLIGYDESRQLVDRNRRREHGLPPVHRMADIAEDGARRNTYFVKDSDWVDFEATVSTDPDQIAVAPGYLRREWTENGRRYFHFEMDSPILHFYSFSSAAYLVRRDRWNDVAIEIYHHPAHHYNVQRMIDAAKKSLAYFSQNFGPYQHRQLRIVEFPRYARFAQSFPNTVPYSESLGFIADLRDPDDLDYVFFVTAHEVAHQWWGHQVVGGNVQGATMLSETLAEYSALMVMEKEYGAEKMRRFLAHELDRYLRGRSRELVEEMPLMRVENQPYIHYNKGGVVMYALRDVIGEEGLNRALARLVRQYAFQGPPYPSALDLMRLLREATPDHLASVLEDSFETITLFDNRAVEASYSRRDDGKYLVELRVTARKLGADGRGVETEATLDDWIDIAVFGAGESRSGAEKPPLYLEKHRMTHSPASFQLVVDQRPARAGIDPYSKLIDRNPEDNLTRVSRRDASGELAEY